MWGREWEKNHIFSENNLTKRKIWNNKTYRNIFDEKSERQSEIKNGGWGLGVGDDDVDSGDYLF